MATKPLAPDADALIVRIPSILERLDPATFFPATQPLEIELGSGDGSFIAEYARAHPDRNFLAVERLLGRLKKIARKAARNGLCNLRAVRIEAAYFIEYLMPRDSAAALHVYFPDPWPKRKHRHHRLVNALFTKASQHVLVPQGAIYLRTDDLDYFGQMTSVFAANPAFEPVETPDSVARVTTDFEKEFTRRGVQTNRAAYRRIQ